MRPTIPAWYGDVDPAFNCSSCGHEMFEAEFDADAGVDFCPKCGRQTIDSSIADARPTQPRTPHS